MKKIMIEKKKISYVGILLLMMVGFGLIFSLNNKTTGKKHQTLEVRVISYIDNEFILEDSEHVLYHMDNHEYSFDVGSHLLLEYSGILDNNIVRNILSYQVLNETNTNTLPNNWQDNGLFSDYYVMAYNKLNKMSTVDKINQVLLVKYPRDDGISLLKQKQFAGFVFYEDTFQNKTSKEVSSLMDSLQKVAKIPLLTATDEEGGRVIRVSSNNNLIDRPFKSPQALYDEGGFPLIRTDTVKKSALLSNLGINVNLAPVVDVSENPNDYIYDRTIGKNANITAEYAKEVIEASKKGNVSYTLKHFPGYGNNIDTHTWVSIDERSIEDINSALLPFRKGINAGAEAVMVNHNVIKAIDNNNPASLSLNIHNLLRDDLSFTGVIMTDDLDMSALDNISSKYVKALVSGNDLLITADYEQAFNEIKDALENNTLSIDTLNYHVFRILAWKYYKGLMFDEK